MPTEVMKPYFNQLADLKEQVPDQAYRIIAELQDEITHFVTEKQLFERGIDGKGKRLKPYTPYTIALKKLKGEVYDRTTLLDTGDFYEDFYLIAQRNEIEIFSSNEKTPELVSKYGEDIFTLTVDNNEIVNEELILPRLIEWLLQNIKV